MKTQVNKASSGSTLLNRVSLTFRAPELESQFQRHHLQQTQKQVRVALAVCGASIIAFALTDVAALGYTDKTLLLFFARVTTALTVMLSLYLLSLFPHSLKMPRIAATASAAVGICACMLIFYYRPNELPWHAMSVSMILAMLYLFIPNSFLNAAILAIATTLAFIALSLQFDFFVLADMLTMSMLLLLINVFGILASRRHERLSRGEYLAQVALRSAAESKANFLATMSHEIRTPMSAVLGFTQLALKHETQAQQRTRLEKALRSGHHLLTIIDHVLQYSRISSGQLKLEQIAFSPHQLLEDLQEMLNDAAQAKGLHLRVQAGVNLPKVLSGDALRISQIFTNYLSNAIKFSQDCTIEVDLRYEQGEQGDWLLGEVTDRGIGISGEQLERLFEPFQQADASITRRFGGTGLGLSICRELAALMGGSVGARSEEGQGSCFWFRVRVYPGSDLLMPVVTPTITVPAALAGLRVLLVDDNEFNRLLAKEILQAAGVQVDLAEDGAQAIGCLECAKDKTYGAVLMDIMMPVMDGLEATRQLRCNKRFAQLPIIAMTANTGAQEIQQCLAAGMNAHIAKPIDEQLLWDALLKHTEHSTEPCASMSSPPRPAAMSLNPLPLENLQRTVKPERFKVMFAMLINDCRQRGETFKALADNPNAQLMQQEAHDLVSTAGHAGLTELEELAKAMRRALQTHNDEDTHSLSVRIHRASLDAIQALEQHFAQ